MTGLKKTAQWYWMPATVLIIGIASIILLIWVERISKKLLITEVLVDAIMDIQIHIATAHLRMDEIIEGKPEVDVETVLAELDQAIILSDSILTGGDAEHGRLPEPLKDPELRSRTEAIKSLIIQFRMMGLSRLNEPGKWGIGSTLYQEFHMVFREILEKAGELEHIIESDEKRKQKHSRSLFGGILISWTITLAVATMSLWSRELRRQQAEEGLLKANAQLRSKEDELIGQREHLAELVRGRTAELAAANEQLRSEIAERELADAALKDSEGQLRHLSIRLMTAQETERKTISRELHDELGHALTVMKLRLRSVMRGLQGHAEIKEDCEDIMDYIDQTIENVRRMSCDLSPTILEDLGLTEAIRWLVDNFNRNFDGAVELDIDDIDNLFPENSRIMIYRVLQEALTNIGKHAQATKASVAVRKTGEGVSFSIENDGRKFHQPLSFMSDPAGKGLGLAIMEERVRMLGGVLSIQALEEKGTRITFNLPAEKG